MATPSDDHVLAQLPAAYEQQVMGPSGADARRQGSLQASAGMPNGTEPTMRRTGRAGDDAYERALASMATRSGMQHQTGSGAMGASDERASEQPRLEERLSGMRSEGQPGTLDRPLLPHAALGNVLVPEERAERDAAASLFPSPFPSPGGGEELATPGSATSLAQHGAAAIRWFSRLGEFVQRKTATVSRTQPGMEATLYQETVWTPGGSRPANPSSQTPLFSGQQVQRMREMTAAAPQLYGSTGGGGTSSDASGSYSRDQLEAEVKRQVQAAMGGQRELVEENQMLRQEVERLRQASAAGYQKAIQRDFLYKVVSKGVLMDFRVMMEYQGAIFEDYRVRVKGAGMKGILANTEVAMVIFKDHLGMIMSKREAIHQDFLYKVVSKGVMVGHIVIAYQEAIQRDFQYKVVSKGAAMTMQMGLQAAKPEQIRPGMAASELPKLHEADEMAAINVGDWLHGLSGPMGDLTDGSSVWWSNVLESLNAYYQDYVTATAVKKLQLKADGYASELLREGKWVRVDKRAASMLLQAIPEGIRSEVLVQSTLAILARILTIYRPGSAVERQQVLKALEMPAVANSPMELVEALRKWARWLKRAQDLGLQVPDASILLRGLDNASKSQLERHGEVQFRTNMLRFSLELDSSPSVTSVVKLHHHLLAEFEQLAYRGHMRKNCPVKAGDGGSKADDGKGKGQPKVRAEMDEFLRNATQVLKMMTDKQSGGDGGGAPSMKMLKKAVREYEEKMALLDSGATHPLRAATEPEWSTAPEVDVVVAGDQVKRMRQNHTGTLLMEPSPKKTQTIIPMGSLISLLGYEVSWTRRRCILRAPDGEEVVLKVSGGCPELSETAALELISKIEAEKLERLRRSTVETERATLRAQMVEVNTIWERSLRTYVEDGKFEDGFRAVVSMPWCQDLPKEHLVKLAVDVPGTDAKAWELMKTLGFNRRMRKRLMHKDWVVKFFSGARGPLDKVFRPVESSQTVVVDVDLMRDAQWDMLREGDGIYKLLMWGASTGRLAAAMASVPNTCSYEHLLRLMMITEVAKEGRKASCEQMDIPDDGVAVALWASSEVEEDPSAKAIGKQWFKDWTMRCWFNLLHFEQGGLGHPMRRPTTMATNMDITELRGVRDERAEEGEWGSRSTWAPMMLHSLVQGWKRWKARLGWYSRMVKTMKAADRRAWERHLANDHVPHRPDCLQCVHNSTGRPHRRCLHKDCYVLSADTLGPVRVPGPKGEKFAVVFTYQYPKQKMCSEDNEVLEEELEGWDLDVKGPTIEAQDEVHEDEDLADYSPDAEPGVELTEEQKEMIKELPLLPPGDAEASTTTRREPAKASEDWWEFREAEGLVVRHHVLPRTTLFRPTSTNGCPVPAFKLEPTRITEVKYAGGGVETETSDWHGPKSGARALERRWTGSSRFRVSAAEIEEDEEELQRDESAWEKLIGDLTKPVEMETIYLVYPIRARRGGEVMLAVQEAVLRLKLMGLPVARLHSDRGSEFASKGLRKWLLDRDIFHTRSESLVPQTNGRAERAVRWFKTRAKTLLAEAEVPLKFWTLAMQHASNRRVHERLGLTKPKLLQFGEKVMIRRKVFGNNKKYDLTDRWEQGIYLGLSDTIKGGAIVLRPSGIITETLNLKTRVVDPHALLREAAVEEAEHGEVEAPIIDLPEPDHRLKGKQPPPALRVLDASDREEWVLVSALEVQEKHAKQLYEMGKFDLESCAELLRELEFSGKMRTKARGEEAKSMILGGYVHGGLRGASKESRKRPWLTKYLNMVMRQKAAEDLGDQWSWTSIGIFKAKDVPPHRDMRNRPQSKNYVMEVRGKGRAGLWMEQDPKDGDLEEDVHLVEQQLPDGQVKKGKVVCVQGRLVEFDPRRRHAYVAEGEDQWLLAAFTPLGVDKLPVDSKAYLAQCGFPLTGTGAECEVEDDEELYNMFMDDSDLEDEIEEEAVEQRARRVRCVLQQELEEVPAAGRSETWDRQLQEELECAQERLLSATTRAMKISPTEAKDFEVERLLESLQAPLEVVHNVSLPEVKRYVSRWKDAILKEVKALVDSGTVRRLQPEQVRELKRCGLTVLPGKAVFTAKPPSESAGPVWYRRKCRIVVCGNYLADEPLNVFASGTSSDSLRTAVAIAVYRRWAVGCTDVSNAFTLAPMPRDRLYGLTPPTVVSMVGGSECGEVWLIERVLYGLREAPRLWGLFRNERLASANIPYQDKVVILECLETEENMWRILYQGETELQGLMLVYVDDILVLSSEGLVNAIYQWLVSEWKCSSLEWLSEGYIRFLGVELRSYEKGIHLSQSGYVRDILRQHGVEEVEGAVPVPCTREWLQDESEGEDNEPEEYLVKTAQKMTGEALWLSTRSRPELAHSVACMAARAAKNPQRAIQIGKKILQFLSRTADYGLWFEHDESQPLLVTYSDASYAPGGGRSFGCILVQLAGMVVTWRASKQPVITLSVAEAELYEGVSAVQMGMGVKAMLGELGYDPVLHLRIDNMAAKGLASESPGSWKTRHLRIRARFLRQETKANRLVIEHCPGQLQKADIGTKAFDAPKFRELLVLWNIMAWTSLGSSRVAVKTLQSWTKPKVLMFIMVCMVIIKGAAGEVEGRQELQLDGSLEFYLVLIVSVIATLAVWELGKAVTRRCSNCFDKWKRQRKKQARLQQRTKEAVEREFQRQASSPLSTREDRRGQEGDEVRWRGSRVFETPERARGSRVFETPERARASTSTAASTTMRSISTQTEIEYRGPQWIDARRLEGFNGPFYATPNGDCIHTVQGCHGQRNATGRSKTFRLCMYCDRDRPLMLVGAPLG
ncbi:GIP [Symbiodinium sp. CCMP2592]|nr:GIP [Symbiodinium sp. CCMP2592]